MLNILITDDHEVVRRGLQDILRGEFEQLQFGEASCSADVLARTAERHWDLILLDIEIPGDGVIDMIERIRAADADTRILILTVVADAEYAVRTLKAGAHGYITKQHTSEELISAVKQVLSGGTYVTRETVIALASKRGSPGIPHEMLSQRELEVLCYIARGKSVKQVAREMRLSGKTVATYITRIKEKTGLHNYVEMARYALRHHLVE